MSAEITAAKAFFLIGAKDEGFQKAIVGVQAKMDQFADRVAGIGSTISKAGQSFAEPLVSAARSFADFGAGIDDAVQRTGVSAEAISALAYAAEQTGTDFKTLESSLGRMQKLLGSVAEPSAAVVARFDAMGLSFAELREMRPEEQFAAIAGGIASITSPTDRAAAAMEIFGKSGAKLVPMLSEGQQGIAQFVAEAQQLGVTLSTDAAQSAAAYDDAMVRIQQTMQGVTNQLGAAMAPALTQVAELMASQNAILSHWITENQGVVQVLGGVVISLTAAGKAVIVFGGIMRGTTAAIAAMRTASIAAGVGLRFMMGPVGWVITALSAAIGLWLSFTDSGKKAAESIGDAFTGAGEDIEEAMKKAESDAVGSLGPLASNGPASPDSLADRHANDFTRMEQEMRAKLGELTSIAVNVPSVTSPTSTDRRTRLEEELAETQKRWKQDGANVFAGMADRIRSGLAMVDEWAGSKIDELQDNTQRAVNEFNTFGTFSGSLAGQMLGGKSTSSRTEQYAKEQVTALKLIQKGIAAIDRNTRTTGGHFQ